MQPIVGADAEAPIRRERPDAGQVAVELGGEEAGPPHLAVADDVDPGPLLVADRQVDAVVEQLREVRRPELAALRGGDPVGEPAGMGVRPDDAGQQRLAALAHRSTSANANARAGLSTKNRRRIGASRPRASISSLKPPEQVGQPRRSAVRDVVALARGVHPEHDLAGLAVLDRPLEELEGAVRRVAPAEALVVDDRRAGREQLAVVAAVDDLVDVGERDPLRRDPRVAEQPDLLEARPCPPRSGCGSGRPSGDASRPPPGRSAGRAPTGRRGCRRS